MSKAYYTLAERQPDGAWAPQFGDYDKDVVVQERRDMLYSGAGRLRGKDLRIVRSGDSWAEIDAAIAKLNGGE